MARYSPHLNRHISRHCSRSGRCRNSSRYRVSALWSLRVNDPVAQEKLLGLGETPSVTGMPPCSPRTSVASSGTSNPSVATSSPDAVNSVSMVSRTAMCVSILLGPSKIALHPCRRRVMSKMRFMCSFLSLRGDPELSLVGRSRYWLLDIHPANFCRNCRGHRVDFGALATTFSQRQENDEEHNGGGRKSRLGNHLRRAASATRLHAHLDLISFKCKEASVPARCLKMGVAEPELSAQWALGSTALPRF